MLTRLFRDPSLRNLLTLCPKHRSAVAALLLVVLKTAVFRLTTLAERFCFSPPRRGFSRFAARGRIIAMARSTGHIEIQSLAFKSLKPFTTPLVDTAPVDAPVIRLASQRVAYQQGIFDEPYADQEDRMAAHRFVWLLILLQEQGVSQSALRFGTEQISYWCDTVTPRSHPLAFETYSICERLTSWLCFLRHTVDKQPLEPALLEKLAVSYSEQLTLLAAHLEYNGSITNNHILNNARALYLCGTALNCVKSAELGRAILLEETDHFITDGVLQEDSSHYQMLLTRSYLEIYEAAQQAADVQLLDWLTPRLTAMLRICDQLHSRADSVWYPLFGDISPDVDPLWTAGYPFCSDRRSVSRWYRIYPCDLSGLEPSPVNDDAAAKGALNWHSLRHGPGEVWIMTKRGTRCHGHNDSASLAACLNGSPLMLDPGLENYRTDTDVRLQVSATAHNTPLLNGLAPDFDRFSFYRYQYGGVTSCMTSPPDRLLCQVSYLPGLLTLQREVLLDEEGMTVTDRLVTAPEKTSYRSNWLFDLQTLAMVTINGHPVHADPAGRIILAISAPEQTVCRAEQVQGKSTRYGERLPAWYIRVDAVLSLTDRISLRFQQVNEQ